MTADPRRYRSHLPFFATPMSQLLGSALLLVSAGGGSGCISPVVDNSGAGGASASPSTGKGSASTGSPSAAGGGIASASSSASGTGSGGGAASSSSAGAGGAAASSASSGVGGAVASSASSGAGGAVASSTSSGVGGGSASSASSASSSSGSGGAGGIDILDCTSPGFNGGDTVWTTSDVGAFLFPPDALSLQWGSSALLVGSTGHVFAKTEHSFLGANASTWVYTVQLDELDSHGAGLGNKSITGATTFGIITSTAVIFGNERHAFTASLAYPYGQHIEQIDSDAVSYVSPTKQNSDGRIGGAVGNTDGELFGWFQKGIPLANQWSFPWTVDHGEAAVVKWSSAGAPLYTKFLPKSTSSVVAGNSGDLFFGGESYPGLDIGCGPLAGAGSNYVARIDTSGQCMWHRFVDGATGTGGTVRVSDPAADGSVVLVEESFHGMVDAGCGPMTSSASGSSFVAKLDSAGGCVWSQSFPVPSLGASRFPSGDLLLSARFAGTLDLGGGPLTSVGINDMALARLDISGAHVWSKSFGTSGVDLCVSSPSCPLGRAVVDATGGVVLGGGPLTGWVDFGGGPLGSMASVSYAVKLDGSGAFLWHHVLPAKSSVMPDPCGAVLVAYPGNGPSVTLSKLAP